MGYNENGENLDGTEIKVAIACQGGGAQTAFTAGALREILKKKNRLKEEKNIELVGFSGTSGGAICAAIAWYGLLKDYATNNHDDSAAIDWLKNFWDENSADNVFNPYYLFNYDSFINYAINSNLFNHIMVGGQRISHNFGIFFESNPYVYSEIVKIELERLLAPFDNFKNTKKWKEIIEAENKNKKDNDITTIPFLIVGASNVKTGKFMVFNSDFLEINNNVLLASCAIPTITRAVEIQNEKYWDGLYSQNPPLRDLLGLHEENTHMINYDKIKSKDFEEIKKNFGNKKPDEIWIIRINPKECEIEPRMISKIKDRQNELTGNLSLEQEIYFIKKINELLPYLKETKYNYIKLTNGDEPLEIGINEKKLKINLDFESKYDRDMEYIKRLMTHGEEQARGFLGEMIGV